MLKLTFKAILILISFSLNAQDLKPLSVKAEIKIENTDGLVNIDGVVKNLDNIFKEEYEYNLVALKLSASGNYSKNTQSGKFSLKPNEVKKLSTLKVVIHDNEEIRIFFFIRNNNKLVSKDTAVIVPDKTKFASRSVSEDAIEIYGLVVEDVITKLGKDFYDYFYQKYSSSGSKYPFVVNINERPLIGINSEITISVDDKVIYKMTTSPNEEYLQASAQQAILTINNYYKKRKSLFKKDRKF